jgi:hypothetical protein
MKAVLAGGYFSGEQAGKTMEDAILHLCAQVSGSLSQASVCSLFSVLMPMHSLNYKALHLHHAVTPTLVQF